MDYDYLINKYNKPGPRYTSYPPVPFWQTAPSFSNWLDDIRKSFHECTKDVDIYIHIPFCKKICSYCGCNRIVNDDDDLTRRYLSSLINEWKIYIRNLPSFTVKSVHLGGGTPTFLTASQLQFLLENLFLDRLKDKTFEGSFEADPRVTSKSQLLTFYNHGFRRLSLGVQDFDPKVQRAISRIHSFEAVNELVDTAREIGFNQLNFDLIFGLPKQTCETIKDTFYKVGQLMPDTIAFYSFAYVPSFADNQKLLSKDEIPLGVEKRKLYETGKEILFKLGYIELGLDHFVLPTSGLYKAYLDKKLSRNFMGYTIVGASTLIGLGTSSISSSKYSFIQNEKNIDRYCKMISDKQLAIGKGHICNKEDIKVRNIIQDILCRGEANLSDFPMVNLEHFISDKLVTVKNNNLYVTDTGRPFLRNIAMSFDYRLCESSKNKPRFSDTI